MTAAKNTTDLEFVKTVYRESTLAKEPKWDLVENYLPLLKSIVAHMRMYFPAQISSHDIQSIGLLGLISATQNFDPERGSSFGNYASFRIKGSLLDELRRLDWVPRTKRAKIKQCNLITSELEQKLKRRPTEDEICQEMKISKQEFDEIKQSGKSPVLLPLDIGSSDSDDESFSLSEIICDVNEKNSREATEDKEIIECLKSELLKLPKVQQKVLAMHYIEGFRLAEIAEAFGLTESRICQIHTQAIRDVRKNLIEYLKR